MRRAVAILRAAAAAFQAVFLVGYPLLVLAAGARFGARGAALLLLLFLLPGLVRLLAGGGERARTVLGITAGVGLLLALAALLDDERLMLAYPTLVNGGLLVQFALSLWRGPPTAERFARLSVSDLTAAEMRYCRVVTAIWCVFFALNGAVVTGLAALAPRAWWAAYAGGVSYVLAGALFAAEYVVRKSRFGRYGKGLLDRLLASFFGNAAIP
jgi:uncharacterized membrane protein